MELRFEKKDLSAAVNKVQGATGRNTIPILQNILIKTVDGKIEMSATDLEVAIKVNVEGTIAEEGAVTVSAKKLGEIVRSLPSEEIKFESSPKHRVTLTCGAGVFTIIGMSDDEFPESPTLGEKFICVPGEMLRSLITKTQFAAAIEETRYFLNGLSLKMNQETTVMAGTDGRRLSVAHANGLLPEETNDIGVIIPIKAVHEIMSTFESVDMVKIGLLDNQMVFQSEHETLSTRLIDGDYPKYEQIVPKDHPHNVKLNSENLVAITRRVALLSNPKTYSVRYDFEPTQIVVSAKTPDLGEARETLENNNGDLNLSVALDARFIMEALSHIETEDVIVEIKDSLSAIVIKPVDDASHLCLVMPMRLDS